jgi:hypothetical protein
MCLGNFTPICFLQPLKMGKEVGIGVALYEFVASESER